MTSKLDEIKSKLSSIELELKEADEKLENLKGKKLKNENPVLVKDENDTLELTHEVNTQDIKLYKEKISKLEKELKKNSEKLSKLREENAKLKKDKINPKPQSNENPKNFILNLKDLTQSIGLTLRNEESKDEADDISILTEEENTKMENADILDKKIKEYEKILEELKEKANQINSTLDNQKNTIKQYRIYLNEVQNYVAEFRENINIAVNNITIGKDNLKLKDYNALFEKVSNISYDLDNIILGNKDNYEHNLEFNLTNIQMNINSLNENKTEFNFKNKCLDIELNIEILKKIFDDFEKMKNKFDTKNKNMDEEIRKLKNLHNEIIELNKIREIENPKEKIENKPKEKNIVENKKKKPLGESLFYKAKNQNQKLDIFKTINLFQKKDNIDESRAESKLLKKNYHEICYIYDEYDVHDIYYTLKAIVQTNYSNFSLASFYFNTNNKIEIQEFDLDDEVTEYQLESNTLISFKIKLYNLDSVKVHIKYKEIRDAYEVDEKGAKQLKIYRSDNYGLDNSLSGANAKYSLILKGNYEIVNFSDYFLIRNTENTLDVEYMWGGIVPVKGKKTRITFSKREVTWSFERTIKFHSNSFIKRTKILVPIEFVGGNNEIINVTPSSPQANSIVLDEKKRQYIVKYTNTKYKKAELIIKGEFKNISKGDWNVDLTDKEIEKLMPEEDVKSKEQLKKIAQNIIQDFDVENFDSDFEYLDYMKIGMWVHKNINYNYGYIGKKCNALKIYKMRSGVCYHYTRLANALLYALGYKVISVSGYFCKIKNKFNQYNLHTFSLIKLNDNKWHPFDTTWGIFTGKLHVGYVFRTFDNRDLEYEFNNNVILDKNEMNGKVIN
jgi:hypothetical protein